MAHESFEPYPNPLLAPPLSMPIRFRGRVGKIGYKRKRTDGGSNLYVSGRRVVRHDGVDLHVNAGDPVFAVSSGKVYQVLPHGGGSTTMKIAIKHDPDSLGYLSKYNRLDVNTLVSEGDDVKAGQVIGTAAGWGSPPHIHFELRRLVNPSDSHNNTLNTVPIDPTRMLYRFEAERHPIEVATESSGEKTVSRGSSVKYRSVERVGIYDWEDIHLFEVRYGGNFYYLPLYQANQHELSLMRIIENAFWNERKIKLTWINSVFFGDRKMIYRVRVK